MLVSENIDSAADFVDRSENIDTVESANYFNSDYLVAALKNSIQLTDGVIILMSDKQQIRSSVVIK